MTGVTGGRDELHLDVRHERERLALYRAKLLGPRPTSIARLRELERSCARAEARLANAIARDQTAQEIH